VPTIWKDAFITPLFKKRDRSKPSNYRPVSLTLICCKIMENIIHILVNAQHGFRKSQIIMSVHDLANSPNRNEPVDGMLLYFSKAFDKVPHQRLLEKLSYYEVRGYLHS
jgi:hypothetical protein